MTPEDELEKELSNNLIESFSKLIGNLIDYGIKKIKQKTPDWSEKYRDWKKKYFS